MAIESPPLRFATGASPLPTSTFTGLGDTALTTATLSRLIWSPGAYRQSAPASAYTVRLVRNFVPRVGTQRFFELF